MRTLFKLIGMFSALLFLSASDTTSFTMQAALIIIALVCFGIAGEFKRN